MSVLAPGRGSRFVQWEILRCGWPGRTRSGLPAYPGGLAALVSARAEHDLGDSGQGPGRPGAAGPAPMWTEFVTAQAKGILACGLLAVADTCTDRRSGAGPRTCSFACPAARWKCVLGSERSHRGRGVAPYARTSHRWRPGQSRRAPVRGYRCGEVVEGVVDTGHLGSSSTRGVGLSAMYRWIWLLAWGS